MSRIARLFNWLLGYPRVTVEVIVAGFWLISTGQGDTLTIIYPHGHRVAINYVNEAGALVELAPTGFDNDGGEYTHYYNDLRAGSAYDVVLMDSMGGVVERARVVKTAGVSIELHYVTTSNWWREAGIIPA